MENKYSFSVLPGDKLESGKFVAFKDACSHCKGSGLDSYKVQPEKAPYILCPVCGGTGASP